MTVEAMQKSFVLKDSKVDMVNPSDRTLWAVVSTDDKDRDGDIVRPKGLNFDRFQVNPVILWAHEFRQPPVAKCLEVQQDDHQVRMKIQFADTAFARDIFKLYAGGFMNSWSLTFVPKLRTQLLPPAQQNGGDSRSGASGPGMADMPMMGRSERTVNGPITIKYPERYGWDIQEADVLECSAVPVPANPWTGMVTAAKSAGVSIESAEDVLSKAFSLTVDKEILGAVDAPPAKTDDKMVKGVEAITLDPSKGLDGVRAGAFSKTISERGAAGRVPLILSAGDFSVTLEVEPLQEALDKSGKRVITEGRIKSVRVSVPDGAPVAPEVTTAEKPPETSKGRTEAPIKPSRNGHDDDIRARAIAALARAVEVE